ncbi:hypothetical protein Pvag_pPag20027 (plasmid) [Pantoea vagans C9-1]|uniref:hypothetical protein n=1 Tax=Pantoea TaxID=53335 RepID=UPI0001E5790C|nr:hypothetical protein [Pantoea vagans]ADO08017.1 hypothetical protein Pvag_pPag20027 [Pantoea vagans C9-1]
MNKPLALCDLDDTLFQTKRKMIAELGEEPFRVGALDRELKPRSYMSETQAMMVDWLLSTAELIPVTARGTEETARVQIPFTSWKVMTHGAVIANPDGSVNEEWAHIVQSALAVLREKLLSYQKRLSDELEAAGIDAWCRMNYEYAGTPVYFVMKHRDSTRIQELFDFNAKAVKAFDTSDFYIHQNGNNVAWIPNCIQKGLAVEWLLKKIREERSAFPVIGLGDSLSDHTFMKHCQWFGMPSRSQFADAVSQKVF